MMVYLPTSQGHCDDQTRWKIKVLAQACKNGLSKYSVGYDRTFAKRVLLTDSFICTNPSLMRETKSIKCCELVACVSYLIHWYVSFV